VGSGLLAATGVENARVIALSAATLLSPRTGDSEVSRSAGGIVVVVVVVVLVEGAVACVELAGWSDAAPARWDTTAITPAAMSTVAAPKDHRRR
jgi:hypothetical protein